MKSPGAAQIHLLSNVIMSYAWGVRDGLANRIGLEPSGEKQAEVWVGAHPLAPSRFALGASQGAEDLAQWQSASGIQLPFLLKVLAVGEVLSIQAHPGATMARAGFAREESEGIPLAARVRNFKDPYPKPELIVALDDGFRALCGFRKLRRSRELIEALSCMPGLSATNVELLRSLIDYVSRSSFADLVKWILTAGEDVLPIRRALGSALAHFSDHPAECSMAHGEKGKLSKHDLTELAHIEAQYPDDPGVLLAVLLNVVTLKKGECLWLPTGTPHAYVHGFGVELMGPSDNVLRGGLTPKHVDPELLARALCVEAMRPTLIDPEISGSTARYAPEFCEEDGNGFELLRISGSETVELAAPACVIVTEGDWLLEGAQTCAVTRGQSALLESGQVSFEGAGELFLAAASSTATLVKAGEDRP